jgi:hypothetical protein
MYVRVMYVSCQSNLKGICKDQKTATDLSKLSAHVEQLLGESKALASDLKKKESGHEHDLRLAAAEMEKQFVADCLAEANLK